MPKRILSIFLLFSAMLSAQERATIFGIITTIDFLPIEAHIWNYSQNSGAISTPDGNFEMIASLQDTLRISSLGYRTTFIIIQQKHFEEHLKVPLKIAVNELEEVEIFRYGLTGNIASDANKVAPPLSQLPYFNAAFLKRERIDRPDDDFFPVFYEPYPDQHNLLATVISLVSLFIKSREKETLMDITAVFDENFIVQNLGIQETHY